MSQATIVTLAVLTIASAASMSATSPRVSIIPSASPNCSLAVSALTTSFFDMARLYYTRPAGTHNHELKARRREESQGAEESVRRCFCTFPNAVLGSRSRNTTRRGTLKDAS